MKLYYRAVTQDGTTIRGLIEAKDISEAAHYLRKHQLIPIKIDTSANVGFSRYYSFLKRASATDVVFFTRQLSSMLTSGLTLMQALSILKNQMQSSVMSEITQTIVAELESGKTFAAAIEKFPTVFSPIYIALVRTAESAGLIDKVLLRLAESLEKQQNLKKTIQGALLYPVIVVVMMIIVVSIMM